MYTSEQTNGVFKRQPSETGKGVIEVEVVSRDD